MFWVIYIGLIAFLITFFISSACLLLFVVKCLLLNAFFRYVSSIIPSGNEDLKGDEAESIIKFKKALGIDDPDAAAVHIEV